MQKMPLCALALLALLFTGCARPVVVVEEQDFIQMARRMTKEMQARNLLDDDARYVEGMSFGAGKNYGQTLFRQLSPAFMFGESGHHYLGATFAATVQPDSRVSHKPNGFRIQHATQTVTVTMIGIVDWNDDGEDEWMISCLTEPKFGGKTRTYYVLVPPPLHDNEPLKGTVAAVYECFGLACDLFVRDSKAITRAAAADPAKPSTVVQELTPGLQNITEPPHKDTAEPAASGLEERSL